MYLGIDLGTSGVKSVLMDDGGTIVASATAPLTVERPHDGWSEQDPASWTRAVEATFAELATSAKAAMGAVRGIGLSGHMHGATLIGADDMPLRPCLLWNDTRAQAEAAVLDTARSRELCGNILFPGFTAPKTAWVKAQEPAVFDRVAKILLPKDYTRLWLTGEHVSEMSDASGTGWLDVGRRDWSDELLGAGGLTRADCHVRARRRRSLVVSIALLAGHTPTRVGGGRGGGDRPAVGRLGCGVPDAVHGSLPVTSLLLTTTHRLGPPLRFGGQRQAQCNAGTRPIYKLYIPRAQCKQSKTLQHPRTHPSPPPPPPQTNDPTRGNSSRRGAHPRPTRPPPAPDATAWQSKGQ